MKNLKAFLLFISCLTLPLIVGGVSGFLTMNEITGWYIGLKKPSFNPPNYLFGPVWTILYLLMGVSFYLILKSNPSKERKYAVVIFLIQLFLNFWWSLLFFNFHLLFISLVEIFLMWSMIILMIFQFKKVNPPAAYLQIPYLIWVTFASILNFSIWYLNK